MRLETEIGGIVDAENTICPGCNKDFGSYVVLKYGTRVHEDCVDYFEQD